MSFGRPEKAFLAAFPRLFQPELPRSPVVALVVVAVQLSLLLLVRPFQAPLQQVMLMQTWLPLWKLLNLLLRSPTLPALRRHHPLLLAKNRLLRPLSRPARRCLEQTPGQLQRLSRPLRHWHLLHRLQMQLQKQAVQLVVVHRWRLMASLMPPALHRPHHQQPPPQQIQLQIQLQLRQLTHKVATACKQMSQRLPRLRLLQRQQQDQASNCRAPYRYMVLPWRRPAILTGRAAEMCRWQ